MPTPSSYDYALLRVVPYVERGEFINAGAILYCRTQRYLAAQIALDNARLVALAPKADVAAIRAHLDLIPKMCAGAGPIGELGQADCFHWLVAPHSAIIQASPVHSGLCTDPAVALAQIMATLVHVDCSIR